jgi:hypothetical protein
MFFNEHTLVHGHACKDDNAKYSTMHLAESFHFDRPMTIFPEIVTQIFLISMRTIIRIAGFTKRRFYWRADAPW